MAGRFFIEKVQKMPVDKQEKLAYTMKKAVMLRYTLHNVRQRNIAYASTLHNRRIARLLYHTEHRNRNTRHCFFKNAAIEKRLASAGRFCLENYRCICGKKCAIMNPSAFPERNLNLWTK